METVRKVILTMCLVLVLGATSWAGEVTIIGGSTNAADTWMNALGPNNNYSGEAYLWIAPNKTALVEIDITGKIPAGQVIVSAELELYAYSVSGTDVEVYMETDSWDESTATWNTSDGSTAWNGEAGGFGTGMSPGTDVLDTKTVTSVGWDHWDVTSAVQAWYDGTAPNYGLLVRRAYAGGNGIKVYPTERAGGQPQLVITYIPEPATMLLLGIGGLLIGRRRK